MTGAEVPIILAATGAGVSIFGQMSAAGAQAAAANKNASNKYLQAQELLSREAINEQLMRESATREASTFSASMASSGRDTSGIGGQLEIHRQTENAIINSQRDAQFKAQMLRAGADVDLSLAFDLRTAGYYSAAGTAIGTAASIYRMPAGATTNLTSNPNSDGFNPTALPSRTFTNSNRGYV